MKHLILILSIFISFHANAQDENNVTLVVVGQGVTQTEAQNNALRSAIEQSFGTFISSNTELLNDSLIKDEIISVANGNIKKFEILSSDKISENNYSVTLNATVSIDRLSSFTESKGGKTSFSGKLFATNVLMIEFYAKNELIAIKNMLTTLKSIAESSFDYKIETIDPYKEGDKWICAYQVNIDRNKNFFLIPSTITKTLNDLSLSKEDYESYEKLNLPIYPITFAITGEPFLRYFLRNRESVELIRDFFYRDLPLECSNFQVSNGNEKYEFGNTKINYSNISIFRNNVFFTIWNDVRVDIGFYKEPGYGKGEWKWDDDFWDVNWDNFKKTGVLGRPHTTPSMYRTIPILSLQELKKYSGDGYYTIDYKNLTDSPKFSMGQRYAHNYPLKKINEKSKKDGWNGYLVGYTICFFGTKENNYIQKENDWIASFRGYEIRSLEEIEKITKWEVSKK